MNFEDAPMERLTEALQADSVVFLLRAHTNLAANWLTREQIARRVRHALMEPAETEVWPLLPDTWAISLRLADGIEQPAEAMHVHLLCRALAEHLQADWRRQSAPDAPAPAPSDAASEAFSNAFSKAPFHASCAPAFTLTPISSLRSVSAMEDNITELNALLGIIVNKRLRAQFQPIVNLRDGQVFGYEALIRGPKDNLLRRPGALFRAAHKARMVSWYDLACQEQCFARAAEMGLKHLLFINMEAEGLSFVDMHDRPLAARARECGLAPASIVVEITERQAVDDFPRLLQAIARLREQGFKIAIDDAGAGYNSLHAIAEIRPDFVKIDRALVRSLDVTGGRRALLAALVQYARSIGAHVLGEGSETYEELGTLIDLGVGYGQGYLMGRPADTLRGVAKDTREFIARRHRQRAQSSAGRDICIGGLTRAGKTLPNDAPLREAASAFYKNDSLTSIAIVEDGRVCGLLMRERLNHILEMARSARMDALLPGETVSGWMQTSFLRAVAEDAVCEIARQATTRNDLSLDGDVVIVNSGGGYQGVLPIRALLEAVTGLQQNRHRYADALTGLPNRVALEQKVCERLETGVPLALIRIDLTGLAAYNRCYGLEHGDAVLHALARMIQDSLQNSVQDTVTTPLMGMPSSVAWEPFIAHMSGDDFVVLTHPDNAAAFCESLLQNFKRQEACFYTYEHLRGGMEFTERHGNMRRAPLLACAAAVVTNRARRYTHPAQMLEDANALLRQVKTRTGHNFLIDRMPPAPQPPAPREVVTA